MPLPRPTLAESEDHEESLEVLLYTQEIMTPQEIFPMPAKCHEVYLSGLLAPLTVRSWELGLVRKHRQAKSTGRK